MGSTTAAVAVFASVAVSVALAPASASAQANCAAALPAFKAAMQQGTVQALQDYQAVHGTCFGTQVQKRLSALGAGGAAQQPSPGYGQPQPSYGQTQPAQGQQPASQMQQQFQPQQPAYSEQPQQYAAPQPAGKSCDQLWYERNAIYDAAGYCFKSAKGRAVFNNASCTGGTPSGAAMQRVNEIKRQEAAQGC